MLAYIDDILLFADVLTTEKIIAVWCETHTLSCLSSINSNINERFSDVILKFSIIQRDLNLNGQNAFRWISKMVSYDECAVYEATVWQMEWNEQKSQMGEIVTMQHWNSSQYTFLNCNKVNIENKYSRVGQSPMFESE